MESFSPLLNEQKPLFAEVTCHDGEKYKGYIAVQATSHVGDGPRQYAVFADATRNAKGTLYATSFQWDLSKPIALGIYLPSSIQPVWEPPRTSTQHPRNRS